MNIRMDLIDKNRGVQIYELVTVSAGHTPTLNRGYKSSGTRGLHCSGQHSNLDL